MSEYKHKWKFINSHESKESNQFCNIYERTDYFELAPNWYRTTTYNK